jgi:hypothetical protein
MEILEWEEMSRHPCLPSVLKLQVTGVRMPRNVDRADDLHFGIDYLEHLNAAAHIGLI